MNHQSVSAASTEQGGTTHATSHPTQHATAHNALEGRDGGVGDKVPDDLGPGVIVRHLHVELGRDPPDLVQPRAYWGIGEGDGDGMCESMGRLAG